MLWATWETALWMLAYVDGRMPVYLLRRRAMILHDCTVLSGMRTLLSLLMLHRTSTRAPTASSSWSTPGS